MALVVFALKLTDNFIAITTRCLRHRRPAKTRKTRCCQHHIETVFHLASYSLTPAIATHCDETPWDHAAAFVWKGREASRR